MYVRIEQEKAQRILNYLVSRPYGEVAALVADLVSAEEIKLAEAPVVQPVAPTDPQVPSN